MSQPTAQANVYGGTSTSEQDALLAAANRVNMGVPDVNDPRPVVLASGTANLAFFQGNTRLAPYTGTAETVTRGSTTYAGSGGPCGLRIGNSNDSDEGPPYQGYVTAYNTSGGHSGGRQMRVVLRGSGGSGTAAEINATRQVIALGEDIEYRVIVWPHTQAVLLGLPAPEALTGCYIYRVNATDAAHDAINYYGGRNVAGDADDVANQSPFIPLDLISAPTLAGYSTLTGAPASGDLVFIVAYDAATGTYMSEELGGDTHELVYTGTRGAVGDRGVWYPYAGLQRAGSLSNATQLVSLDAPFPSAAGNTEDNWYLRPTVTLPPNTWTNGQTLTFRMTGNVAWGNSSVCALELLMFFCNAEEGGWDPHAQDAPDWPTTGPTAVNAWYEKGPYQTFTGGSYVHSTRTLTVPGIGDAGHACVWVTGGTGATVRAYLVESAPTADSVVLKSSIGAGADGASNITGFAGGIATVFSGSGETWISGKLNQDGAVGPVLILQSEPVTNAGNVNFSVEVKITHIAQPLSDGVNGQHVFNVEAEFSIGGASNTGTGVAGSAAVARTTRRCSLNLARQIVNLFTEHVGITTLFRTVDATSGTGDINLPGVHGWYPSAPYNPKNGMGWPIRFTTSSGALASGVVATTPIQDGTRLIRPREWEFVYSGSQTK